MTFKPMTYLVSFTLFVLIFTALGAYVGYGRIADQLLTQAFLDAAPLQVQVRPDPQGPALGWDERVALPQGGFARVVAGPGVPAVSIEEVDAAGTRTQAAAGIPLAAREHADDLRVDRNGRYLYARILTAAKVKAEETTWICKYDLKRRRLVRRTSVNPILLPAPFRP
ncbi:MAG: hypothetical protein HXX12_16565 [Geothrix sp.]|uniref:hypothetical protein n=1 Tax=Geothrix sp. TaxID=1962974 RepID=UPI0017CB0025|nr:hypothetical protein [Geothrix sp.]NWJ42577.1 hypothetical protein [Geothrix sp.]WIL19463.1 MAG: hypothetical protein QOZ81_001980 [Geothrix sp.]